MEMFDEDSAPAEGLLVEEPELRFPSKEEVSAMSLDEMRTLVSTMSEEQAREFSKLQLERASNNEVLGVTLVGLYFAGLLLFGPGGGTGSLRALIPELRDGPVGTFFSNLTEFFGMLALTPGVHREMMVSVVEGALEPRAKEVLDAFAESQKAKYGDEVLLRSPEQRERMLALMPAHLDEGLSPTEAARLTLNSVG